MAPPSDRMRLKDRIIDNISKAIKSIQELVYYQYKDPILSGSGDGVLLYNGDRLCSKLCENLDHTLLHGLKHVMHGYWRVVKQLSPHTTVREIDLLVNVTTDLGRGRAWLYSSLNEGLLESYIRLLCDNDKLLRKYYAKEALVLDKDRMSVLLTLASGLECVTFKLDYDVPYLDLNAYPPRSRSNSRHEDETSSGLSLSRMGHPCQYRRKSEVCSSWSDSSFRRQSDSDSASLASLDAQLNSDTANHMKMSTISADSGFPVDSVSSNGTKQHSTTPTEPVLNSRQQNETPSDTASLSSTGSWTDPDKHQRLVNVISAGVGEERDGLVEVFHMKNKKCSGNRARRKKDTVTERDKLDKKTLCTASKPSDYDVSVCGQEIYVSHSKITSQISSGNIMEDVASSLSVSNSSVVRVDECERKVGKPSPSLALTYNDQTSFDSIPPSIPKFDSGVDICGLAAAVDIPTATDGHRTNHSDHSPSFSVEDKDDALSDSPCCPVGLQSSLPQVENKGLEGSISNQDMNFGKTEPGPSPASVRTVSESHNILSTGEQNHGSEFINILKTGPEAPMLDSKSDLLGCLHCDSGATADMQHSRGRGTPTASHQIQTDQALVELHINSVCDQQFICEDQGTTTQTKDLKQGELKSSKKAEDVDIYSSSKQADCRSRDADQKLSVTSEEVSINQVQSRGDYTEEKLSPPAIDGDRHETQKRRDDLCLSLDNNTKLQLMLDVFTCEDEQFLKMFATWEDHTEGNSVPAFILISDQCFYILQYHRSSKKFIRRSCIALLDIVFVATGMNGQTLNIESRGKSKRKQKLWVTPGHQSLTQAILSCITSAVKAVSEHLSIKSRFSVGSEVPLQKIALRKYISRELHCQAQDVTLYDYSLVFWEDLSMTNNSHEGVYKEGPLLLRTQESFRGHTWKPVYVVLKNSMLCILNTKHDPRPFAYLGLGGDQCVGCRQTSVIGHGHCVELILAQGGSWLLSAVTQAEISEWRHSLCLAVSRGTLESSTLSACIPCCAVLASNHLFLCHEDLHTKFYRTLGMVQLDDITGILVDDVDTAHCIIEFKSQESGAPSGRWVLYFSSSEDLERHRMAFTRACQEVHQTELLVTPLENLALRYHCRTFSDQLRQKLTVR